jgi:hypothetical protein
MAKKTLLLTVVLFILWGGAYVLYNYIVGERIDIHEANSIIARGCTARIRDPVYDSESDKITFFFVSKYIGRKTVEPDVFCIYKNRLASCFHAKTMILASGKTIPDGHSAESRSSRELRILEEISRPPHGISPERVEAVFGKPGLDRMYPNQSRERISYFELSGHIVLCVEYHSGKVFNTFIQYRDVGSLGGTRSIGEGILLSLQPAEIKDFLVREFKEISDKYGLKLGKEKEKRNKEIFELAEELRRNQRSSMSGQ